MGRLLKCAVMGAVLLPFLTVSAVILFWLGRNEKPSGELVVADYDDNDPGKDVDGEE